MTRAIVSVASCLLVVALAPSASAQIVGPSVRGSVGGPTVPNSMCISIASVSEAEVGIARTPLVVTVRNGAPAALVSGEVEVVVSDSAGLVLGRARNQREIRPGPPDPNAEIPAENIAVDAMVAVENLPTPELVVELRSSNASLRFCNARRVLRMANVPGLLATITPGGPCVPTRDGVACHATELAQGGACGAATAAQRTLSLQSSTQHLATTSADATLVVSAIVRNSTGAPLPNALAYTLVSDIGRNRVACTTTNVRSGAPQSVSCRNLQPGDTLRATLLVQSTPQCPSPVAFWDRQTFLVRTFARRVWR